MKLEKIINGIRKFGNGVKKFGVTRGVGIGISSAALMYSGGCESPEENIALATLGNMVQSSPNTSANDKVLGVGASTVGQMGYQMNTAREGKTEVNVNVVGGSGEEKTTSPSNYQNTEGISHFVATYFMKNGEIIRGVYMGENESEIVIYDGKEMRGLSKLEVKSIELKK